jgi:hypothetical protein
MLLAAAALAVADLCVWCSPTHGRVPQRLCLTFCKITKVRDAGSDAASSSGVGGG